MNDVGFDGHFRNRRLRKIMRKGWNWPTNLNHSHESPVKKCPTLCNRGHGEPGYEKVEWHPPPFLVPTAPQPTTLAGTFAYCRSHTLLPQSSISSPPPQSPLSFTRITTTSFLYRPLLLHFIMFSTSDHHMLHCPPRPLPSLDKGWKSNAELAPSCPRCSSPNTKFCYYNNYSLSQPRYFCKGCRRYWTKGGSLRNVPVGGGCRKNRRGKAVRVPQLERGSGNYGSDAPPSGDSVVVVPPGRTGGAEIDLAVVFAKFLNHNSGFEPEVAGSALSDQTDAAGNVLGALNSDAQQEDMAMECGTSLDLMGEVQLLEGHTQLFDGGEKQIQEERIQEFTSHDDASAYGLPTLLSDEAAQEVLWSDAQTLQNFTWQPVMQLQEFESVPSYDHSKMSPNLIGEFWSSFWFFRLLDFLEALKPIHWFFSLLIFLSSSSFIKFYFTLASHERGNDSFNENYYIFLKRKTLILMTIIYLIRTVCDLVRKEINCWVMIIGC